MSSLLRNARSMPSLRSAYQQGMKQQLPQTPKSSFRYYNNSPQKITFTEDDLCFVSRQYEMFQRNSQPLTFTRSVHQTSKNQTTLLGSNAGDKYLSMNLQGLKMECRKRGLKVSGKKLELIQRLSHSDAPASPAKAVSRRMSTKPTEAATKKPAASNTTKTQKRSIAQTASSQAKGDSSTIESYKIPQPNYPPPDPVPPIKIPSLSTKASLKDRPAEVNPSSEKDILSAKVQGAVSLGVDSPPTTTQAGVVVKPSEITGEQNEEETDSVRDKGILAAIAVATMGWWYLKPKTTKN